RVLRALNELKKKNLVMLASYQEQDHDEKLPDINKSQMIEMGKNKLAFGKWEEAINLFNYVLQYDEANHEAKELLNHAEIGLVRSIYEETISPDSIPQL